MCCVCMYNIYTQTSLKPGHVRKILWVARSWRQRASHWMENHWLALFLEIHSASMTNPTIHTRRYPPPSHTLKMLTNYYKTIPPVHSWSQPLRRPRTHLPSIWQQHTNSSRYLFKMNHLLYLKCGDVHSRKTCRGDWVVGRSPSPSLCHPPAPPPAPAPAEGRLSSIAMCMTGPLPLLNKCPIWVILFGFLLSVTRCGLTGTEPMRGFSLLCFPFPAPLLRKNYMTIQMNNYLPSPIWRFTMSFLILSLSIWLRSYEYGRYSI